ncbi:hypothetical protein ACN469_14580 [Corallococcus terminator]
MLFCVAVAAFFLLGMAKTAITAQHDHEVIRPLIRRLRCPGCRAPYGDKAPEPLPPTNEIVRMDPDPREGFLPPPEFQVTCTECGLAAVFTEKGRLKETRHAG